MITDSGSHHSNDFGVTGELGCEEDDRDEYEQRTEHIHIIRYEVEIIIEDNLLQRHLIIIEVIEFLSQVEDDGNTHDKHNREEESA